MDPVIALPLIPFTLSGQKMIGDLWLKASSMDELATIGSMRLVRVVFLGKYRLDVMVSLVIRAVNPDPFRLVYCWYSHRFPPV
jgi:hypothetical protein